MADCQECTEINDSLSKFEFVNTGIPQPQGSILGSILFLLYMNDLPTCVTLFADDTMISVSAQTSVAKRYRLLSSLIPEKQINCEYK